MTPPPSLNPPLCVRRAGERSMLPCVSGAPASIAWQSYSHGRVLLSSRGFITLQDSTVIESPSFDLSPTSSSKPTAH